MAMPGIPAAPRRRISNLHTGAIIIAILSGSYALVALLEGEAPEFGAALALCGACWITAHFIEWTVEAERGRRRTQPTGWHTVHTPASANSPVPPVRKLGRTVRPTPHAEKIQAA
jgi:hypothetical protein